MQLKDVLELISRLKTVYVESKVYYDGYDHMQVIWDPQVDNRYFRISFDKEKSGGYLADVFYKTCIGNVHTRINKRSELEACMSLTEGGTDMKRKFKVGDKVRVVLNDYHLSKVKVGLIYTVESILDGAPTPMYIVNGAVMCEYELVPASLNTQIIINNPATVINWDNGQKTVVKCDGRDEYDELFGIALAALKYTFGNDEAASKKAYELLTSTLAKAKEFKIPDAIMEKFTNDKLAIMVSNQEEWETLLKYLEKKGFVWNSGHLPTKYGRNYDPRMGGVVSDWMQNRFGMMSGKNSKEKITFKQIKGGLK